MALYAISDLHLSLNTDKPMDIFGDNWAKHDEKIKENWLDKITDEDTILIAGDISWAMKWSESEEDLKWIDRLPGNKIISKGNHDYWWASITKLNKLFNKTKFIQNNFYTYEDYAICGSRGWTAPNEKYTEHDIKIYSRECIRLKLSLDEAKKAGYEKIIVMIHYPPMNDKFEDSEFTKIFEDYKVEKVIYGHIHGYGLKNIFEGNKNGVEYIMTSSDYLKFNPIKIL